ncbi:MAG: heavy metal-binding domain-containing protein [Bacteroidota bacterium]
MKKYIIITSIALLTFAAGCSNGTDQKKSAPADGKTPKIAKQYTCTMHPDIVKDKPGLCPKCGMELVEKDKTK